MTAPYAESSSSRRKTPKSTSCSKSPRTAPLDLNHIVGDINTTRSEFGDTGIRNLNFDPPKFQICDGLFIWKIWVNQNSDCGFLYLRVPIYRGVITMD